MPGSEHNARDGEGVLLSSLGVSVDVSNAAIHQAKIVIAQLNPNVPRTFGDGIIHVSKIDALVEVDKPLFEHVPKPISELHMQIGKHIAELVEDGATLQTGIGAIPSSLFKDKI